MDCLIKNSGRKMAAASKRISFAASMIAASMILSSQVLAGPFDELLGAALKEVSKGVNASQNDSRASGQQGNKACLGGGMGGRRIARPTVSDLYNVDFEKMATVEDFCEGFRNANPTDSQCNVDCEERLGKDFSTAKAEKEQRILAEREASNRKLEMQEDEKKKLEIEKQNAESLDADLRAGRVKPTNIHQAAIAFSAENGYDLAKSPKIRPDGKLYALIGKITIADEKPEFVAHLSLGKDNDLVAKALNRSGEIETTYFSVKVPKSLQNYYFDQARIGGGFDIVGRYISNFRYKTVSGQENTAPVFEAQYFVFW